MLELENFKITAYLFSFQIIWESVCIFLRFLVQVMSHPSYLIYIIIHQRTVKNSLNQIHHGDDLYTLDFIIQEQNGKKRFFVSRKGQSKGKKCKEILIVFEVINFKLNYRERCKLISLFTSNLSLIIVSDNFTLKLFSLWENISSLGTKIFPRTYTGTTGQLMVAQRSNLDK